MAQRRRTFDPCEYDEETLASFPKPPPLPREREALARRERMRVAPPPPPPPASQTPDHHGVDNVTPLFAGRNLETERFDPVPPPPPVEDPTLDLAPRSKENLKVESSRIWRQRIPELLQVLSAVRSRIPQWERKTVVALGIVSLCVLTFLLFSFLSKRPPVIETEPRTASTLVPEPGLIRGGQLLIDASPWGQISSLVNSEGELIPLPEERQTPLVLDLPTGLYTALLTHPELAGEHRPCVAKVTEQTGGTCRLDLLTLSTDQYWEDMRW